MKSYQVGETVAGEYRVEAVLGGAGLSGMGSVYKVRHRDLEEPLVIKTIQAEQQSRDLLARFRREAMLWVELGSHPNVVRAIDVRELDWQLAIIAEYVEPDAVGRNTVGQYIRSGAGGLYKALRWAQQFGFAMQHAASRGLHAHRDIKPDNLMVNAAGDLKVTDFGLARAVVAEAELTPSSQRGLPASRLTMVGSMLGTPHYMAPEQFVSSDQVDLRSDLYAFGIVLYEVLSGGQFPYRTAGDTIESLMRAHMTAEPQSLDTPMWSIVERCLQKQPAHRFQSIEAFLESVAGVARQLGLHPLRRPQIDLALAEELYAKAQALVGLGRPRDALRVIEDYLERWPDEASGWTEKGRIHLTLSENAESVQASQRSLELNPGNSHALNNLGLALKRLNRAADSIRAFREAIVEDPQNTGAMMNMAEPLLSLRRYAEASAGLVQALRLAPTKETLRFNANNCAVAMLRAGEGHAALEVFEELVKLGGEDSDIWSNLAAANLLLGNRRTAIGCFEKLLSLEGPTGAALLELTRLYADESEVSKALSYCDQALRRTPGNARLIGMKAQLLQSGGRVSEAEQLLSEALGRNPADDLLWYFTAHICTQARDWARAIDALQHCEALLLQDQSRRHAGRLREVRDQIRSLQMCMH